jgi:predicted ATP-grasp superfamily ATP-dependent carboligase
VLSGEPEFTEQGTKLDFRQFYDKRIELLTKESAKKDKHRTFEKLIEYFDSRLFPAANDGDEQILDDEERELLQAFEDDSGDEEEAVDATTG